MKQILSLIKECLSEARKLNTEKENSQSKLLKEKLDFKDKELIEAKRLYESARKITHYSDRALHKVLKNPSQWKEVHDEIMRCIEKYANTDWKTLIDKHYECE